MRPTLTLVLVVLLVGASLASESAVRVESLLKALAITPLTGQASGFTLTGLDGKSQALADLKGQVVLLYFWATW